MKALLEYVVGSGIRLLNQEPFERPFRCISGRAFNELSEGSHDASQLKLWFFEVNT
jgi:hypothetical protein